MQNNIIVVNNDEIVMDKAYRQGAWARRNNISANPKGSAQEREQYMRGFDNEGAGEHIRFGKDITCVLETPRKGDVFAEDPGVPRIMGRVDMSWYRKQVARMAPFSTTPGSARELEEKIAKVFPDVEHRRIVCAANRWKDGTLITSARHFDELMRQQIGERTHLFAMESEQGFIDQFGTFHTRTEAWKIAKANDQIRNRVGGDDAAGGTLYSENLY